ncbi:MAG: hypothetical protein JNK88_02475 [Mangrovicoccus sp.]|nr:hypothetical protein [Mangrovicoccus sp.]
MISRHEADTGRTHFLVPLNDADEALNLSFLFDPPGAALGRIGRTASTPHARPPVSWPAHIATHARRWLAGGAT